MINFEELQKTVSKMMDESEKEADAYFQYLDQTWQGLPPFKRLSFMLLMGTYCFVDAMKFVNRCGLVRFQAVKMFSLTFQKITNNVYGAKNETNADTSPSEDNSQPRDTSS